MSATEHTNHYFGVFAQVFNYSFFALFCRPNANGSTLCRKKNVNFLKKKQNQFSAFLVKMKRHFEL